MPLGPQLQAERFGGHGAEQRTGSTVRWRTIQGRVVSMPGKQGLVEGIDRQHKPDGAWGWSSVPDLLHRADLEGGLGVGRLGKSPPASGGAWVGENDFHVALRITAWGSGSG